MEGKALQLHTNIQTNVLSIPPADLLGGFSVAAQAADRPPALVTPLETIEHHSFLKSFLPVKALHLLDCGGGSSINLYCTKHAGGCGSVITKAKSCGSRLCKTCRPPRGHKHVKAWKYRLADMPEERLALITLTLRISPEFSLAERFEFAYEQTKKLFRQKLLRQTIKGYVRTIEVKPARNGLPAWNVHVHIIAETAGMRRTYRAHDRRECELIAHGYKLTRQSLSSAWKELTGDSYRVDIVPIKSVRGGTSGAVRYMLKYVTKPAQDFTASTKLGQHQILEYQKVMKGRRVIQNGGCWHMASKGYNLRQPLPRESGCRECGGKLTICYDLEPTKSIVPYSVKLYFDHLTKRLDDKVTSDALRRIFRC